MRSIFVSWLIVSFLAIAVFGFLAMDMENGDKHANCLAAAPGSAACPNGNAFAAAFFHIAAYKNFSAALLVLALTLSFGLAALFISRFELSPPDLSPSSKKYSFAFKIRASKNRLIRWLALHENSPSFPQSAA